MTDIYNFNTIVNFLYDNIVNLLAEICFMLSDNDKTMENTRKLKIHTKYQPRAYRKNTAIPEIRLEGKWLEKLGFTQGQMVIVTQKKNKLTTTRQNR